MNKQIKIVSGLVLIMFFAGADIYSKSWPRFMRDKTRSGYTREQAAPPLTLKWSYDTFNQIGGSPVVKDGIIYIGDHGFKIYAISLDDSNNDNKGDVIWQKELDGWIDSTPCVENGQVYVFSMNGDAASYNAETGALNWSKVITGQNQSSPLVVDGYIYIGRSAPNTDIVALNSSNGDIAYTYVTGGPVLSSPLYYDNSLFVCSNDGSVYRLDKTLNKTWKYSTLTGLFRLSTPSTGDERLYMAPGSDIRKVYSIDTDDPHNVGWQSADLNTGGSGVFASSVASDEDNAYVVMISTYQVLYSLDKTNGSVNWSVEIATGSAGDSYISSPAVTHDTIYVGSEDGYLVCLSTYGVVQSSYPVNNADYSVISSPAVSNGYVFVASKTRKLYAYKASRITSISSPDEDDILTSTLVTVTGSAVDTNNPADFNSYTLDFGTGTNPPNWHLIASGTEQVDDSTLGTWNTSSLLDGTYTLRLGVDNSSLPGEARNIVVIDNPPAPPTSVSAQARALGNIKLDWTKSEDDGAGNNDVLGYKIFRRIEGDVFDYSVTFTTVAPGIQTYTDEDIILGEKYCYVMRSYDTRNDSENTVVVSTTAYKETFNISSDDGGTVQLDDGTGVYFPPGALKKDSEIAVSIVPPARIPSEGVSAGNKWQPTDKVWEFEIEPALDFNKNATLKLAYSDTDISGLDEDGLRVYWYDTEKKVWRIIDTSVPFANQKQVHAYVPHFTTYRIAQYLPPEYLIAKDSTYVYPNPARSGDVTFKFIITRAAGVKLKIFNVAGELVEEFSENYAAEDAGKTQEIEWNIDGIASGVYVWYIKARNSGREDQVIKKLAIIK